jgi:hypothetical protein
LVILSLNPFFPHGSRPDPEAAFTVKSLVHDHRLQGLRMGGYTDESVFLPLKMTVFTGF